MKQNGLSKALKVLAVLMVVLLTQLGSVNVMASEDDVEAEVGSITCYCNTSGAECASNGATNFVCRKVKASNGDCSSGKVNCTTSPAYA